MSVSEYQSNIKKGEFFRSLEDQEAKRSSSILYTGELVFVEKVNLKGEVTFLFGFDSKYHGYNTWSCGHDEFIQKFEHVPNGYMLLQQEVLDLIMKSTQLAEEITNDAQALAETEKLFMPRQLPGLEETESNSKDLVPVDQETILTSSIIKVGDDSTMLSQAKDFIRGVADRRNAISEKKHELLKFQKKIESLQEMQKKWMDKMTEYKDFAKKLEEVINTLHLYLGNGEEIIQLMNGKPCAAEVPLTIRQLVLFMDEECALESESQGIDASSIEEFDKWIISDEKNLNQIIPEKKAIVALKPCRNKKEYGDEFINLQMEEANRETYILIRNGENLFRLCPIWKVGKKLFPTKKEFEKDFVMTKKMNADYAKSHGIDTSDWKDFEKAFGKEVVFTVTPADEEWEERMEQIVSGNKYYAKALLMIQGIIDRTGIFPEFQKIGLNLMDVRTHNDYLRYVHDADESKLLSTGKETFSQWFDRIRKEYGVGDRIIGAFRKFLYDYQADYYRGSWKQSYCTRISPKQAPYPDDYKLYTLEKLSDDGDGYKFSYERDDQKWSYADGYQPYKTKASCVVKNSDDYVIPYDYVTLEDIEFWMTDRLSRHDFLRMFPLLKRVRNMKRKEREEETPFIDLIVNQLAMKHTEFTVEEIRSSVNRIVQWYKFKTKIHRALHKDEDKAYRMIIEEFEFRLRGEQSLALSENDTIVEKLKRKNTMLIARRGITIIRLDRMNKDNIFTRRKDFNKTRKGFVEFQTKDWYIPGREFHNWEILWEHDDYSKWPKGSRVGDFLTEPEIFQCYQERLEHATQQVWNEVPSQIREFNRDISEWEDGEIKKVNFLVFSVDKEKGFSYTFIVHYISIKSQLEHTKEVNVSYEWERKRDGVKTLWDKWSYGRVSYYREGHIRETWKKQEGKGWDPNKEYKWFYYFNEPNYLEYLKTTRTTKAIQRKYDQAKSFFTNQKYHKETSLWKRIDALYEKQAFDKYIENYGDPLNWSNVKDSDKKIEKFKWHFLDDQIRGIAKLIVRDIFKVEDFIGLTLNQVKTLVNSEDVPEELRVKFPDRWEKDVLPDKDVLLSRESYNETIEKLKEK